jgi:hypothetical protein
VTTDEEPVPPAPVAVAEYDVVAVGESLTLPARWEFVVTVRDDDPAVAVIVTEVAFALCQLRVMLCPELIAMGVAARLMVGLAGGGGAGVPLAHPHKLPRAMAMIPGRMLRKSILLILVVYGSTALLRRDTQMLFFRESVAGESRAGIGGGLCKGQTKRVLIYAG